MTPVIRISEPTFRRLQALARPFEPRDAIIDRLLDLYDDVADAGKNIHGGDPFAVRPAVRPGQPAAPSMPVEFNPDAPPDLTHARFVSGSFDGKSVDTWNGLIHMAHRAAFARLGTAEKVKAASRSNILLGHSVKGGFHPLDDLGISIQNVNANDAWRRALYLARSLEAPIQAEVEWERRREAAHPGQQRTLEWSPVAQIKCEFCGKMVKEKLRYEIGKELIIEFKCGHVQVRRMPELPGK